ncbi:MAG: exodeoxyribonuclease VII small subunit [Planctomycetota bacterium]
MPDQTTDTDHQPTFEQSIEQLEAIVEQIESGEVGLEQAIERYEAGQKLIQRCRGILDKAEQRIAELTEDAQGNLQAPATGDGMADEDA